MAEANTMNGYASCKNDEQGGAREVFRDSRCSVLLIEGFQIAICPGCNWLAELNRHQTMLAGLKAQGFHVRVRRPK